MRVLTAASLCVLLFTPAWGTAAESPTATATVSSAARRPIPKAPDGFTVELVAGAEHVQHPMMGCLDDRGRLYVCESAGTNRRAADLIADPQDSIRVLEDTDGDGIYDKSWTYADKLVFPQGCLWYRGAVYTCSSPYLWKLEDTDGDGVCDKRTVLVKSFGFSGNAADIHGPFLSPDGRIYWCDGRHGHEIRDLGDGQIGGEDNVRDIAPKPEPGLPNPEGELISRGKAARIFSCRPDGSDLRILCGGGMDNPVELDFWETGECIGTVNLFYGRPRGDCLVHWVEGGVYPRDDMPDCIAEFPWTGGLLDPVTNYGHVAVSGMCRYRSQEFGDLTRSAAARPSEAAGASADRAAFFVTLFNTHKVVKTVVERHGSTFRAVETTDFVVFDDPDVHPTDVLEDADGSLLVIDTGGWFRIGCPQSQVAKPEVGGAIYRVRRNGAHRMDDPRGLKIDWQAASRAPATLLPLLADARPAVRERAKEAVAALLSHDDERAIEVCQSIHNGGRLMERLGFLDGVARARRSLMSWHYIQADPDVAVRLAALQAHPGVDATLPDSGAQHVVEAALPRMESPQPAEARAAMEAVGLLLQGEAESDLSDQVVRSILERLRQPDVDRTLEHAAIVALTRMAGRSAMVPFLSDRHPGVQKAALIALDQMPEGRLRRDEVLPLLATSDAGLRDAALDVISRREGWAAETVSLLKDWLAVELVSDRSEIVRRFIAAQARDPAIQTLVADSLARADLPASNRSTLLEAMTAAEVAEWPQPWTAALTALLNGSDADGKLSALRIIGARRLTAFDAAVRALFVDKRQPLPVRVEALAIVAPRLERLREEDRKFISETLQSPADLLLRLKLAAAFAAAPLTDVQVCTAASLTPKIGAAFVPALWPAFEQTRLDATQLLIVRSLSELADLPPISERQLRELLAKFTPEAQAAAAPLLARFAARDAVAKEQVDRYLPWAEGGDAARGRYVFFGQTAACSRCHRVGSEGAQIGPDLTRIGAIRQPRDLVEAVVLPSASFARDFNSYVAVTSDGRQVNGLIVRQTSDSLVFRQADLSEVRLPRDEIEILKESETSIMPQGLEQKLSEQEFRDLLAYLQSLK